MIDPAAIEDALIADIKANISGVKTVATHERSFDEMTLNALMPSLPFILIRYGRLTPVEGERFSNGASGMKREEFHLSIGSESLRSARDRQRGCYALLAALRARYDGRTIAIGGETIVLGLESIDFIFASGGMTVYQMVLSFYEN